MLVWLCRNNRAIVSMYMKLAVGGQGESATFFVPVGIALLFALYSCFLFMRLLPKLWLLVKAKEFLPLLHGVCGVIALCGAVYDMIEYILRRMKKDG
jgi:hypothetical protein